MLYFCDYVVSLTPVNRLAAIAGKKLRVYRFSMYRDAFQLNAPIIKKETIDFHCGGPVATAG